MEDESNRNNLRDEAEEIFSKIKEQVSGISHNMAFLMEVLENKFRPFKEASGSVVALT
jgi:hypothetical protein